MSLVSDQQISEIRSRADIVQVVGERVPLKRAGRNFKGVCPFHAEKTPSFMVHPEKQIFHCFGCGVGGDVFSFLMKFEGMDFGEALETLAERCSVVLERSDKARGDHDARKAEKELLFKINRLALRFFYDSLQGAAGSKGRAYLEGRATRPEMIREAYLGYAPADGKSLTQLLREKKIPMELAEKLGLVRRGTGGDFYDFFRDRLMFTVVSSEGKVLGFSGRALNNNDDQAQPKYLNSPESPIYHKGDSLLGIHLAKNAVREKDQAILVEGNFDLLRLHQEGLRNVVAPLGTALTENQVRYLRRFTENFILLFDGDRAGVRAAERALEIFLPLGLSPKVVLLPEGEDPDSFVKRNGAGPLTKMIEEAPSLLEIRIEHILETGGRDPQGQAKAIRLVGELVAKLPGDIEKVLYIRRLSDRFGLQDSVFRGLTRPKAAVSRKESNFSAPSGDHKTDSYPPIERTVLEVLLSGEADPGILLESIDAKDFSHPVLGGIWDAIRRDFAVDGRVELVRLLAGFTGEEKEEGEKEEGENEAVRRLVTELAFAGGRWKEAGGQVAADCLRQLRVGRLKTRLKDLSREIRRAEMQHDAQRMSELMSQKNALMKEMRTLH